MKRIRNRRDAAATLPEPFQDVFKLGISEVLHMQGDFGYQCLPIRFAPNCTHGRTPDAAPTVGRMIGRRDGVVKEIPELSGNRYKSVFQKGE
jgi:hypothetical protein